MRSSSGLLPCIGLALLLAACGGAPPTSGKATAAAAPIIGIDLAGIDKSIAPGDDFDAYANGLWRKVTGIPPDRASTGMFLQVFNLAEQRQKELVQDIGAGKPAGGTDAARIADYYTAFMDASGVEARGLAPLQPQLAAIAAIADRTALAAQLGAGVRADVDPLNNTSFATENLFGLFVTQGLEDASRNIGYLLQGGLGLPDRDYYLSADKSMVELRGKYRAYIAALLKLAAVPDAETQAAAVYELEKKIAAAHASITDSQDIHKANNLWSLADFPRKAPGMDWNAFFKAAGLDGQSVLDAWQPRAVTGLSGLVASQPLASWKSWLVFHLINQNVAFLPRAFYDLSFGFYGTALQGTPQQRERWKRALALLDADLGDALGKAYVAKYFPAAAREHIRQLVANLIAVFPERIDRLDWMSPQTREKAKAKVATIRVGVGYPDTWRDYAQLAIRADDPLGNHRRAQLAEYRHQLAKLGTIPDRDEWWIAPQTVNALNLPLQNALNFPAAILEPPFFDPQADDAANYGSIGAVIGHEISHSFDNLGAEFDAQGRLRNWWTPADAAHFKAAGKALIAQYDAYEALPGLHLKGAQELGENIADLAGLAVAYDAYHKSLGGAPAPVLGGLTGDQRFFLAFAQSWRDKTREAALRARVATDVHAPDRFRAQTVRNNDAWYAAFGVQPARKLYLAPAQRVKIW
ncbi:MAG TPA: M13 family metallopeptidase [Steroidobacteraceae bacterium]|nr:M13 family metallopeptidase [Steroidobacteraceae bacterium]